MQITIKNLLKTFICLVAIMIVSFAVVSNKASAETFIAGELVENVSEVVITGTWRADDSDWGHKRKDKDDDYKKENYENKIHLNFTYQSEKGGRNSHGSMFSFDDLEGLSKSQTLGDNSTVNFRLVREAGTINCEGIFRKGKGIGEFTFTPNQAFADAMKTRGFEFSERRMFSATTLNLTTADVDDLLSANFPNLTIKDFFKAKIFKVNSAFMKEMAATGFPDLSMKDLVKARIFKVDANFVKQVVDMGFSTDSFQNLTKLRIFKITPEYLREMKTAGFPNLTAQEAIKLRIHKVTPEFIREMGELGFNNLSASEARKLRIHKVTPEFIKDMRNEGLTNLSVRDATKLRIHRIDADFVRRAKAQEGRDLTVSELVKLKIHRKVK